MSQEKQFSNFSKLKFSNFQIFFFAKWSLGIKRGAKKAKCEISAESDTLHFVLFSIPEEIAMHVAGRKFSIFSKF